MFVSCLHIMWVYLQLIWGKDALYLQPMRAESSDVCGSEGLRLWAVTIIGTTEGCYVDKVQVWSAPCRNLTPRSQPCFECCTEFLCMMCG